MGTEVISLYVAPTPLSLHFMCVTLVNLQTTGSMSLSPKNKNV
jgi:hypothetical protein